MTEDFIGCAGSLEEEFIHATNERLQQVAFENMEARAAKEKPQLLAGLAKLKEIMPPSAFESLINEAENINLGENGLLLLTGDEKKRTELVGKFLPLLREAFGVANVRIVGGGRNGIDAY